MYIGPHPPRAAPAARLQIFVSDLSATGVVRNAIGIANAAAEAGYDVRLLTCHCDGELRNEVSPRVWLVNLTGDDRPRGSRRSQMKRILRAYRKHSRTWRPHILFSAGNHGHLLSTVAWLGLPGRKVLRISNDLNHGAPSLLTRLVRGLKFHIVTGLADRLVLVSRALGQQPLLASRIASGAAVTIPNGVDISAVRNAASRSCPHRWAGDDSVPILLAVGRLVKQKNYAVLLEAFAHARRERPMRLIILGGGPRSQSDRLGARAAELGISDHVDLVPPTNNPFPYMAAARVLALPSLWEGSANVLLEAMACGTPVIASRTAGDADHVLGSGRYGALVDPDDVDGLARAILQQMSPMAVRPGARAEQFRRSKMLRRYIALFDELTEVRAPEHADVVLSSPHQAPIERSLADAF